MRFDLNTAMDYIFPSTPKGICRYCRKPIPKEQKRRYQWCEGHDAEAQKMLSWESARHLTYNRDNGICQKCGIQVYLYGDGTDVENALKYYRPEYKDPYRHYYFGERKAEIHHVIPMMNLMDLAFKVTNEIEDEEKRQYWAWKIGVMLQLDINNLTTLCVHPCHDDVHNHANNLARKIGKHVPRLETYGVLL